jgi:hypothetical protein
MMAEGIAAFRRATVRSALPGSNRGPLDYRHAIHVSWLAPSAAHIPDLPRSFRARARYPSGNDEGRTTLGRTSKSRNPLTTVASAFTAARFIDGEAISGKRLGLKMVDPVTGGWGKVPLDPESPSRSARPRYRSERFDSSASSIASTRR